MKVCTIVPAATLFVCLFAPVPVAGQASTPSRSPQNHSKGNDSPFHKAKPRGQANATDNPKNEEGGAQQSSAFDEGKDGADKLEVIVNKEGATGSDESKKNEDIRIQRRLADLTTWLVIVGFIQAAALVATLIWIRQQAKTMKEHAVHLENLASAADKNATAASLNALAAEKSASAANTQIQVMNDQFRQMEHQTGILERSVAASEASAKAANDNIELFINRDRARLRIEMGELAMHVGVFSVPIVYQIHQVGSSDAFILDSRASMHVTDSKNVPTGVFGMRIAGLPPEFRKDSPPIEVKGRLLHTFTEEEILRVQRREAFVHFHGFVKYKDVFERQHELKFNTWWDITDLPSLSKPGEPWAHWVNCGTDADNADA